MAKGRGLLGSGCNWAKEGSRERLHFCKTGGWGTRVRAEVGCGGDGGERAGGRWLRREQARAAMAEVPTPSLKAPRGREWLRGCRPTAGSRRRPRASLHVQTPDLPKGAGAGGGAPGEARPPQLGGEAAAPQALTTGSGGQRLTPSRRLLATAPPLTREANHRA